MDDEPVAPDAQLCIPPAVVTVSGEPDSPALATDLEDSFFETRRLRHDGWDGAKMARFCGTLAETGVVTFACRAAGMSAQSAYSLRHRHPVFDKAWEAAVSIARERLADELLARSLKGGAEQLLKDGCIVAERHTFDNKLAFAILRRLDRRAELGATFTTPARADIPIPAPAVKGQWQELLDALSEDRQSDARTLLESPKVDSEVDNPPVEGVEGDDMDEEILPDPRIWWDMSRKEYRTNFPPPEGSDCHEHEHFGHRDYHRSLTADESELMARRDSAEAAERRAADVEERDAFFANLDPSCSSPLGEADFKAPSAPLREGNVGEGKVARSDGGVSATTTPPSAEADTSPKGERRKKVPTDVKSSPRP